MVITAYASQSLLHQVSDWNFMKFDDQGDLTLSQSLLHQVSDWNGALLFVKKYKYLSTHFL